MTPRFDKDLEMQGADLLEVCGPINFDPRFDVGKTFVLTHVEITDGKGHTTVAAVNASFPYPTEEWMVVIGAPGLVQGGGAAGRAHGYEIDQHGRRSPHEWDNKPDPGALEIVPAS